MCLPIFVRVDIIQNIRICVFDLLTFTLRIFFMLCLYRWSPHSEECADILYRGRWNTPHVDSYLLRNSSPTTILLFPPLGKTCVIALILPTIHSDYSNFTAGLEFGILNCQGFGHSRHHLSNFISNVRPKKLETS